MFIRTLAVWALGVPLTVIAFILIFLSRLVDRSGRVIFYIVFLWFKIILLLAGVRISVKGANNIPRGQPLIIASNHQGAFDIPVLQVSVPVDFRWVAKKSLFKVPLIGWCMILAGYISIDRENAVKAYRSMEVAAEQIKAGKSVLVFPEGTRSDTGALLPFKRGVFMLAVNSGAPIIPVAVAGTKDIMKRGSKCIMPSGVVSVSIGKPIETAGLGEGELRKVVRAAIDEMLKSMMA